jgi:outer membrane protein with beta-barrel domain
MGTLRTVGCWVLLALAMATTAQAQEAAPRQGFWIGGGLGYGSLGCEGCDRLSGFTGYLKLGGTVRQSLLLGVEMNGWGKSEFGQTITMGNLSGAGYWYPLGSGGLFVKAGLGYSVLDDGFTSETGFGLLGGLGYDVRITRNLSLTPVANWYSGSFTPGALNVLDIGIGITSH